MQIKKPISLLTGSILLTSSAQALQFNPESNAILILSNTISNFSGSLTAGSYYIDTGVTADAIRNGAGFTLDLSGASASLGRFTQFTLVGLTSSNQAPVFNYDEGVYVSQDAGLIYAQFDTEPVTNTNLLNARSALMDFFATVPDYGFYPETSNYHISDGPFFDSARSVFGTFGSDGSEVGVGTGLITGFSFHPLPFGIGTNLYHQSYSLDSETELEQLTRISNDALLPDGCEFIVDDILGISGFGYDEFDSFEECLRAKSPAFEIQGDTFILNGAPVPLPTAAYLFITAIGLVAITRLKNIRNG